MSEDVERFCSCKTADRRNDDDSSCNESPTQNGPSQPSAAGWGGVAVSNTSLGRQGEREPTVTAISAAGEMIEHRSAFDRGQRIARRRPVKQNPRRGDSRQAVRPANDPRTIFGGRFCIL